MERDSDLYHCYITHLQGEQAKGMGTILTVIGRAVAEIPASCKRALVPNVGASAQKPAGLGVSQEPRSLHVAARENMTLSCTFQNRDGKRTKVLWLRGSGEDLELDSNHPFYRRRLHVSRMDEHRQGKATLTLAELQERDSGLYHCCIKLDRGETGMGGGTELRVMRRNQSETALTVLQSPAVLRASPGETMNISCSFKYKQGSVVKATWTRAPGVLLESDHPFYRGRLIMSDLDLLRKGEATLTLSDLEQRDSGRYRCQISIRQGESGTGVGTDLQVTERNQSDTGLTVLQSPAVLQASPGETVNLSCSFENRLGSMAKATWTRAPRVELDSDHPFYKGRLNVSHLGLLQKGEATLILSELEQRDSGLYWCQISIHLGDSGTGAGTELRVMGRNHSDTGKEPSPVRCFARELLYQVAIALGLLLIIGLVATLLLKKCQATPPSQPRQRQPKGHGSQGVEGSKSLHYAEIKIQTPGCREHTSNHTEQR
ncbi:tyrosine-protein phosphatase non-receptor type substrate 1-like isoform X2 [Dermochelys coriacea]|uniref:tyrosine-protein phosphatase non-receptor type substrate 1-like isoform X2 n=1 Tax=Dermochelys coriacea TaxID=27794 RepID=UPI001CA8A79C|nr:tyrosine-protein phosphatase non-receptor type substrate 1-like isoform X2 [Dermochelys coriacea]